MRRVDAFWVWIWLAVTLPPLLYGFGVTSDVVADAKHAPVRICADYAVTGPEWRPDPDDLTTEVAARLLRDATAGRRDIIVLGFDDTYDGIGANPCRLAQATQLLKVWVHRNRDRSFKVTSELTNLDTSKKLLATSGSGTDQAKLLAQSVRGLLTKRLRRPGNAELIDNFGEYPYEDHHLALAKSRMLRLLGQRYGQPHEESLFQQSQSYLESAVDIRKSEGKVASFQEVVESLASAFRDLNLNDDTRFREEGGTWIARAAELNQDGHPDILVWEGIYHLFVTGASDISYFNRAIDDGVDENGNPTREGRPCANAYFSRGLYHERVDKNQAAALKNFRKAVDLNPMLLRARSYLVRTTPDFELAKDEWSSIVEGVRPYGLATYQMAWRTWKAGDVNTAIKLIEENLLDVPDDGFYDGDAFVLKARIQTEDGRWAAAEKTLVDSLQQVPNWTTPPEQGVKSKETPEIGDLLTEYRTLLNDEPTDSSFANIQQDLTNLLLERHSVTLLEQSILALAAAHAGDDQTAVEIVGSLEQRVPGTKFASDKMLHVAMARAYALVGRDASADVVRSAFRVDLN